MIEWMTDRLMKWAEKRGKIFMITGTAGPEDVYLIRYYIVKSRYFNFFIHQFLRSDRDDLHDHPWDFCTYLVRGAYTERRWNPQTEQIDTVNRENIEDHWGLIGRIKENTFVFRKATDQHQVIVDRDLKLHEKDQAATTLFFSGPTKREWGFVRESEAIYADGERIRKPIRTWVPWKKYLGLPEDTPGRG